jgi:hypothetical protein
MVRILIFNTLYIVSSLFALIRGGAPERMGAIILIADFQLSAWVVDPMHSRFAGVEWPMFAVDSAAFAALYILSLVTTRYWPAWMAGIQACVALSHLAGLRIEIIPWAYGTVVAGWAYAMLVMLAVATWRHRQRIRRYGTDPAWYWELPPTYRSGTPRDGRLDMAGRNLTT